MTLTQVGKDLLGSLETQLKREEHARLLARQAEAGVWADGQIIRIREWCETAKLGTTIELIDFKSCSFDPESEDGLRLAALEAKLGVLFDRRAIKPGVYHDNGGSLFAIEMELGDFVKFLRKHQ